MSLSPQVFNIPLKHFMQKWKEVCRNARCTFFFIHYYTTRFIFFKLRYFEDFFDLCVRNI